MKRIETQWRKIARNGGGLFIGIRWHFPVNLVSENGAISWTQQTISVGFVFWQFDVDFNYNFACDFELNP